MVAMAEPAVLHGGCTYLFLVVFSSCRAEVNRRRMLVGLSRARPGRDYARPFMVRLVSYSCAVRLGLVVKDRFSMKNAVGIRL